jgi:sarcosine oxidase subunit beta
LLERQTLKRDAGAPIEFVTPAELADREPEISRSITMASYCAEDGYANSSLTGAYYRKRLRAADVAYREHSPVTAIDRSNGSFVLRASSGPIRAHRILLAAGAWLSPLAAMLDVNLPVHVRVNTVAVTEAVPPVFRTVIGHATGLLTMKQKPNGTVLIGGGWQGAGTPQDGRGRVVGETLVPNIALARFAVPALAHARLTRSWTGFEAHVPDFYPLAGPLPGINGAFVLGCVRGGYTIGPYIAKLMADQILGHDPELPLFDPGRSFEGIN